MTAQQRIRPTKAADTGALDSSKEPGFFRRQSTARILPFAIYIAFIAIADGLAGLGWSVDELRWLYAVKITLVVAAMVAYRKMYVELAWRSMSWRCLLASVVTGLVVLVLWVNLDADWMQVGKSAGFDPTAEGGRIDWLLVAVRIAGAAVVVPLMEELFWRSFLMRWLEQRDFLRVYPAAVGMQSIAITVVLFGFEHNLWLAGIVAGISYSWLYIRSGNLWAPVLAHAVTNGLLGAWVVVTSNWTYW
ncbi:CAAX prenyl protease-related protein [Pseudoduganella lutea]|uniref:CAAX prenyl protease-related protein n=1 Tax=Pseudoduganella lutea TaxID=321985 RepID=A0A4P6KUW6_9BURK|nr:CAAX prenyl protease-related protein [Pseudoduganella lutea]QBE62534.1 CAAX prenyl protease-related protein [Pseudoduganella lutea]